MGLEADAADVEVFLEAIGLEEVGEFQGPDVAAALTDFALEIADDAGQVVEGDTGLEQLVPHPLAIKAQAYGLAGELAVEGVGLGDAGRIDGEWGGAHAG
jgi:hypothetical protein